MGLEGVLGGEVEVADDTNANVSRDCWGIRRKDNDKWLPGRWVNRETPDAIARAINLAIRLERAGAVGVIVNAISVIDNPAISTVDDLKEIRDIIAEGQDG